MIQFLLPTTYIYIDLFIYLSTYDDFICLSLACLRISFFSFFHLGIHTFIKTSFDTPVHRYLVNQNENHFFSFFLGSYSMSQAMRATVGPCILHAFEFDVFFFLFCFAFSPPFLSSVEERLSSSSLSLSLRHNGVNGCARLSDTRASSISCLSPSLSLLFSLSSSSEKGEG